MHTFHAILLQGLAEYARLGAGGTLSKLQAEILAMDTETFIKAGAGLLFVLVLAVNRIRPN